MKILQVTPYFSPAFGGSAMAVYQLSKELARRRHEVTVFTGDNRRPLYQIPGTSVRAFKTLVTSANFYVTPGMMGESFKQFDVVHLHNHYTFQNVVAHSKVIRANLPYVLQAHGSLTTYFQRGVLKRLFNEVWGNSILRHASKLIAVTEIEVGQYESMNVNKDRVVVVPNGIDLSEFEGLPKQGEFKNACNIDQDTKVILFVGRINWIKGLDVLVKAFALLLGNVDNVILVVVGPDDGYLTTLKKLVADLRIRGVVKFVGPLYEREKLEAYVDSDVFVMPSRYEIFSISILEALICGVPIVVSEHCGVQDSLVCTDATSGDVGLVVSCTEEQLCGALLKVLGDSKLRLRFSEKGKLLVREKFNWQTIAGQMENVYEEIQR